VNVLTNLSAEPHHVPGTLLATAGHPQLVVVSCPRCGAAHRHLGAGIRRAACGEQYVVQVAIPARAA
jgi:hypothetical protein